MVVGQIEGFGSRRIKYLWYETNDGSDLVIIDKQSLHSDWRWKKEDLVVSQTAIYNTALWSIASGRLRLTDLFQLFEHLVWRPGEHLSNHMEVSSGLAS